MSLRNLAITGIVIATGLGLVLGCGGGGGGGGESVTYNGETMAAVIDSTDAVNTALDVVLGTSGNNPLEQVGGYLSAGDDGYLGMAVNPKPALDMVRDALSRPPAADLLGVSAQPLATECMPFFSGTGLESGTFEWIICADPDEVMGSSVYDVKMEIHFYDFSDAPGEYTDGSLIVDGTFDEPADDFTGTVRIIFRDFVSQDVSLDEDVFIDGWVDYTEDDVAETVTIIYNMFAFDSFADEGAWMSGYTIFIDYGNDQVTLSGTLYDFYDGFVIVTTESPLSWVVDMDVDGNLVFGDYPTGGTVKLTCAEGYWIAISFTPTDYTVQVNYTGDAAADVTFGPYPWVV